MAVNNRLEQIPEHSVPAHTTLSCETRTAGVVTCSGNSDTHIRTGEEYRTISWNEIASVLERPTALVKKQAPAIIPSTYANYDGRSHQRQRQVGSFIFLCGDVDKGNPSKQHLLSALQRIVGSNVDLLLYSTSSASADNRKWRFLIRLETAIDGHSYIEVQNALFELLEIEGICCDHALARAGQLVYLPNIPPASREAEGGNPASGRPLFYEFYIQNSQLGTGLRLSDTAILDRIASQKQAKTQRIAQMRTEAEHQVGARRHKTLDSGELESVIGQYNEAHSVESRMREYGYIEDKRGNWSSPHQQKSSGNYSTVVLGHRAYSLSGTDAEKGLGRRAASGGVFADAFDLFIHFEHGGDFSAALTAYRRRLISEKIQLLGPEGYLTEKTDELRREQQKAENRQIGNGEPYSTKPEQLTLEEALLRFAFASNGSQVIDLAHPTIVYNLADFRSTFAASIEKIEVQKKHGELITKEEPLVSLWLKSNTRHTVQTRTFNPKDGRFTFSPSGASAVNIWRPYQRNEESIQYTKHVAVFVDHIRFLFGNDAERFINWLAHIEQKPGSLPHQAWLHISTKTGTGRNALASILTRIWKGHVAACFNLMSTLKTNFNDELSMKLLAIVDEIREGARQDQWEHSETLKRLITEEQRTINPKYGMKHVEFNCCRFLLFSNSPAAIPIEPNDRRFEVAMFEGDPKPESYYRQLYSLVHDLSFIADIALYLSKRDIAEYSPGARATLSEAKARVIENSQSDQSMYAKAIADFWPADVIANHVLAAIIIPGADRISASIRQAAVEAGLRTLGPTVHFGKPTRAHIIRNYSRWKSASSTDIGMELARGLQVSRDQLANKEYPWREYLDRISGENKDRDMGSDTYEF